MKQGFVNAAYSVCVVTKVLLDIWKGVAAAPRINRCPELDVAGIVSIPFFLILINFLSQLLRLVIIQVWETYETVRRTNTITSANKDNGPGSDMK